MKAIAILLLIQFALIWGENGSITYIVQNGKVTAINSTEIDKYESLHEEDVDFEIKNLTITGDGWIQGFCNYRYPLLYTENFILENDNNSQVGADMEINIGGKTLITCVKIIDRSNATESPRILGGGVGFNYVRVSVMPAYGKGFDFSVKLYGFTRKGGK